MSGAQHGFSDKVTKALVRYHEDTLRQKLISDAAAAYDDEPAVSRARPPETDARYQAASAAARAQWEDAAPAQAWDDHAETETVAANPLMRSADGYLEPRVERHVGAQVLSREARRRKAYRWLMILIILPLAGWIATRPVDTQKVLTVVLASYGEEAAVSSPVDGTLRQIRVQADSRVTRGQMLVQIEPDMSPELIRAQREWVSLRLRESAIKARLDGESDIAYPIDLANAFPAIDIGPLLERERERLRDNESEAAEILGSTQRSIDAAIVELTKTWAEKLALEKRLTGVRNRLSRSEALLNQNVVFEDGVYTEQLVNTLRATERGVTREFSTLSEQEEQINERLRVLKATLAEQGEGHRAKLRRQLEENRASADKALATVEDLKVQAAMVDLNAQATGWFEPNAGLVVGAQVARGDSIGLLRVPGETAVLESPLADHEVEWVAIGQSVVVTLSDRTRNSELLFDGRVASILANSAPSVGGRDRSPRLLIEIDVPTQGGHGAELMQGMSGQVRIETDGEMLWHWGWRALARTFQGWAVAFNQRPLGPADQQAARSDPAEWIE